MAQQVSVRTRARCSRARRWPVTWGCRVTTQNLEVVSTDDEHGLILIHGAVPGAKNGWVLLSDAVKKALPEDAPFPAGLVTDSADAAAVPAADEPAVEAQADDAQVADAPEAAATQDEKGTTDEG